MQLTVGIPPPAQERVLVAVSFPPTVLVHTCLHYLSHPLKFTVPTDHPRAINLLDPLLLPLLITFRTLEV